MRTNGFAVFRGPGARASAEAAAAKIERKGTRVTLGPGSLMQGAANPSGFGGYVVVFSDEDEMGFPVVHGFSDESPVSERGPSGEFALVDGNPRGDGLIASRDVLGTRPLYVNQSGSCVASDHRAFGDTPTLLPNGATLDMGSLRVTRSKLPVSKKGRRLDECAERLSGLLIEAVAKRVRGRAKVAVSFSGGLDSSLIALLASRHTEVVLCSVFSPGSRDENQVRTAAEALGLDLATVEMDSGGVSRELSALDLPFEPTPMDRALWCIYSASAREAASQGAELIMLGQLADELFGGYMKYAQAAKHDEGAAAAMMKADVIASGAVAFVRDEAACARFCEVRFPYADEKVASFGLALPVKYKVAAGERKVVLRKAASMLGLPEDLVNAPKKAAQYSSGVAKLIG